MPQTRFSTSVLGVSIAPAIIRFLKENTDYMKTLREGRVEDGAEAIAHAIAYGVSLALSNSIMQTAFAVGIAPVVPGPTFTPGGPIGVMIYNVLKPNVIEQ